MTSPSLPSPINPAVKIDFAHHLHFTFPLRNLKSLLLQRPKGEIFSQGGTIMSTELDTIWNDVDDQRLQKTLERLAMCRNQSLSRYDIYEQAVSETLLDSLDVEEIAKNQ